MADAIKAPGLFQVELTNYCNIDCTMCARSAGLKRPIGHMDLELSKKLSINPVNIKCRSTGCITLVIP